MTNLIDLIIDGVKFDITTLSEEQYTSGLKNEEKLKKRKLPCDPLKKTPSQSPVLQPVQ